MKKSLLFFASVCAVGLLLPVLPAGSQNPSVPPPPQDPVVVALEKLKDKNPMVRYQAIDQLGVIRDNRAVGAITESLQDDSAMVRSAAANALGIMRVSAATPKIADLMVKDKDPQVRQSAAIALSYLANPSVEDAFIQALKDSQLGVRLVAIRVLGTMRSPKAAPLLAGMIKDNSLEMRRSAVNALGLIGTKEAAAVLSEALKDSDAAVRAEAVKSLGVIGDPAVKETLITLFKKDTDTGVRIQAAKSLGRLGDSSGASLGLDLLKNANPQWRREGAGILGMVGDKEKAFPAVNKAIADEKDPATKQTLEFIRMQMKTRLKIKDEPAALAASTATAVSGTPQSSKKAPTP